MFIHCFWSRRIGSALIFRVFSTVSETKSIVRLKAELHGLQAFGAEGSMPRTVRPSRKLESWQHWLVVGVCSCLQKTVSPDALMWNLAWKSNICAHFIIKLFICFRGVAAKDLVRDGRQCTHKEDRIEKWAVAVHQTELPCQVFLALPAHFPVFTNISFSRVAVWKSSTERRGAAWPAAPAGAQGEPPRGRARSPLSHSTRVHIRIFKPAARSYKPGCYL